MEMSQSHEWLGKATKKQTPATSHTAQTMAIAILETFWFPRCSNEGMRLHNASIQDRKENINTTKKSKPLTS